MYIENKVSVIMSVYNAEKYLEESIESILNQTYKNFEFIIINDGSTDSSLKIIQEYMKMDNRIKLISRENKGLVYSLNQGIKLAKGKYIARMDADDVALEDRLEKQRVFLEKNNNIDIVASSINVFGDVDNETKIEIEKIFDSKINEDNMEKMFLDRCIIPHPTIMVKKEIFNVLNGYNESFKTAEDYDLWLRAIKAGFKIEKLHQKLLNYRVHNESKSKCEIKNNLMTKYVIFAKLNYLEDVIYNKKINYVVWGASNGGESASQTIKFKYPQLKFVAYIDKFKEGMKNGVKIVKPDELTSLEFDYVFIATTPGKEEAEEFLNNLGYKFKKDFCYIL